MVEIHEAAELFPLDEETIPELAENIKRHGLLSPILLLDGKVLDGRRRLRACELAGVQPAFEHVVTDDPLAYSWSLNGTRRHLTTSQKAMAGARMRAMYDEQARERMRQGGEMAGKGRPKQGQANSPDPIPSTGQSRDHVAKVVGVGGTTIDYATKVLREAVPEIVEAVESGRMSVSAARDLLHEDEAVQREKAAKPKEERRQATRTTSNPGAGPGAGLGVQKANQAIDVLKQIPQQDPQREMARKIIVRWAKKYL